MRIRALVALLAVALLPGAAHAQTESIVLEAESGVVGSQFSIGNDGATQFATIVGTIGGGNPSVAARVITFTVNFPSAGTYELYARLRVGPATFNDDSFYYANGFGTRSPASDADWILANNLANPVGYTSPSDKVTGGGLATSGVWKWVKLSAYDGGEPPISFVVPAGSLTQTFQVAGREDGLGLDKFAFGHQGVFYTVFDLDNGLPGTTVPPPPPFVPPGPPIATGQPKFLGCARSNAQAVNFTAYWNQVTPENGGKWGSVEGQRDQMNWADLDAAYNLAKANGFPFRMHTLIWGNQQPGWIESLPPAEQLSEIQQWFAAVAARYPDIDFIDVVNEPLHDPPRGATNGNYIEALGGEGPSGWEWVLRSFRMARRYFPQAKLGINDYSVTNNTADMQRYIGIIQLLQAEGLIDTVGVQGHAFSTRVAAATTIANLDLLATTGLPIYVTELDIDGPTDEIQLADYQRIFPAFWEHPAVRGITLWGYRPGHWRTAQGAYIVLDNGAERPAMVWLQSYVKNAVLRPWITTSPTARTVTVGDTVSFTGGANGSAPLSYRWRKAGAPISANASAATPTLTLTNVTTADAGSYDLVISNASGSATTTAALLTVEKAVGSLTLSDLHQTYNGAPHVVSASTVPPGLAVAVTYDGSATAPVNAGIYTVDAAIDDANYIGLATGTLTIDPALAGISIGGLSQSYDGTPRGVTVTTVPAGLAAHVTYDGSATPPTAPGSYAVIATVDDANYVGAVTGTLRIASTALVRHAPILDGKVDGSVQVLLPESLALDGSAGISGDLLLPGTPEVRLDGHPTYGGTVDGSGSASPSNYTVTLNGGAALRHVGRRSSPVALPTVTPPAAPAGTRNVVLNAPGEDPGSFATIRSLTLSGNAGPIAVPPGTYGTFTASGHGGLILGVSGSSEPAVYDLQGLTLGGASTLQVVGPVILKVGSAVVVGGRAGSSGNPEWLRLEVFSAGLTLNDNAALHGFVAAPSGTVIVSGTLRGGVASDRLIINGGGVLKGE